MHVANLMLLLWLITDDSATGVTLLPSKVEPWLGTNVTLSCSNRNETLNEVFFTKTNRNSSRYTAVVLANLACPVPSSFLDSSDYIVNCTANVYSVTIRNVSEQNHWEKWVCYIVGTGEESNTATLYVKVPVRSVDLSPDSSFYTVEENKTLYVNCTSSACLPKPTFRLYLANDTPSLENKLLLAEQLSNLYTSDEIQSYTVSFVVTATRAINGWRIFCTAANSNVTVVSVYHLLNVLYPPTTPTSILEAKNGSVYHVLIGNHVNFTCSVTGGNPLSHLAWNTGVISPSVIHSSTVTRVVNWLARERYQTELRCQSTHPLKNYTAAVVTSVLYPPSAPSLSIIKINNQFENTQGIISVIENSTLRLTCTAISNPPPNSFRWSRFTDDNTSTLIISNIERSEAGSLACQVYNEMVPTVGMPVLGINMSEVYVDVLYPPEVKTSGNKTLIEGENLIYECMVDNGNPNTTVFSWINATDGSLVQTGRVLQLTSISRSATGWYICVAENVMYSTDGTAAQGFSTGKFYLDIQYAAFVSKMMVDTQSGNNITLNENDTVKVLCTVEGNPAPVGRIFLSTPLYDYDLVVGLPVDRTFEAEFVASCYDAGEYVCIGSNTLYTGEQHTSTRVVMININCAPRMSRIYAVGHNVYTPIYVSVTLTFTAVAYPVPPPSGYTWSRQISGGNWANITRNNSAYTVSTQGLQSNLTVISVAKSDYGLYNLTVSNNIGTFMFTFSLVPAGKPSPPVKYGILEEAVTDRSVTIWWEPEFDGGDSQRFIISYRISSSDAWLNLSSVREETATDNSMTWKIGGLKSGTLYHVLIYAENKFGSVRIGREISVTTKEVTETSKRNVGAAAGGGVGGAVAVMLFVVAIIIVIYKRKKAATNTLSTPEDLVKDHTYHNHSNNELSTSVVYQTLQISQTDEEPQYQQLVTIDNKEHVHMETLGQQKVYENLRITSSRKK